ncbi:MAG: hypothetical protein HYR91_02440 [Flavobacteriia bacterium]|nr:hypothetical protein [Flavobacteriia bacterium]
MKKSIIKITAILLLSVVGLTSCHKTVTKRKLDGEWTLTSGTSSSSYTNNGITTTSSSTYTETEKTTVTGSATTISDYSRTFKFDKKAGTYTLTTVTTSTSSNEVPYYLQGSYFPDGTMDKKDVKVSTYTENGTFTITGGTGEIEKNSQIVMLATGSTNNESHTYTYFEPGTSTPANTSGRYTTAMSTTPFSTSSTATSTTTEANSYGSVITVKSLKKGKMEIEMTDTYTETSGSSTTSSTSTNSFTLTEKK